MLSCFDVNVYKSRLLFLNCPEYLEFTGDGRKVLHFTKCFAFYMQVFVSPEVFFVHDIVYNFAHNVQACLLLSHFPPFKLTFF